MDSDSLASTSQSPDKTAGSARQEGSASQVDSAVPTVTSLANQPWQRLSAIAIVHFLVNSVTVLFQNVVYLIPVLVVAYNKVSENPELWLPLLLLLVAFSGTYSILNYWFFQYRYNEDSVEIRSGVLQRKLLNLPFHKIQNVTLEHPVYFRPFGFVILALDTAGSAQQEARIAALKLGFAEHMKQHILAAVKTGRFKDTENVDLDVQTSQETVLNHRNLGDLVIHGLTNNVWILVGLMAPFYDHINRYFADILELLGWGNDWENLESASAWQVALYGGLIVLGIIAVMTLVSIAGAIIKYHGYSLSRSQDRLIQRSGLFTRREISLKLSRLQMVVRKQDWLDGLLGRCNLVFKQNKTVGQQGQQVRDSGKILVPSVTPAQCEELVHEAFADNRMSDCSYLPIHKRFIVRTIVFFILPLTVFLALVVSQQEQMLLFLPVAVIAVALAGLTVLRWYRWGYQADEEYLYLRKGLFGIDYYCIPLFKIQQVHFHQSVWMRRQQLAHVTLHFASGSITVPFVAQQTAWQLVDYSLFKIESQPRSWM